MGYKILSQGVLDGTCLMYSIMNAYKTLFYPELDCHQYRKMKPENLSGKRKWEHIISIYPRSNEMLISHPFDEYFTTTTIQNPQKFISLEFDHLVFTSFDLLSDTDKPVKVEKLKFESIKNVNFIDSVVILNIANKIKTSAGNFISEHFICINGKDDKTYQIACSFSIHAAEREKFIEFYNEMTKRYYNNSIKINDLTLDIIDVGMNEIYKISRA